MVRFRNIVFTLNNPTLQEREAYAGLRGRTYPMNGLKYITFSEERGEQGTVHFQGYGELMRRYTLTSLRHAHPILFNRAAIYSRRGTQAQAIHYVNKPIANCTCTHCTDCPAPITAAVQYGDRRRQGSRKSTYKNIAQAIQDGEELKDLQEEFPGLFLQNKEKINDFYIKQLGKRDWSMQVDIFYGKTGTGKTYMAHLQNPDAYPVPWPTGGRWWWPEYCGQHTCIMDEFRHQIKMDVMLKMLDRYSWYLERKNGNMHFVSKKIVITTNVDPKDWYPNLTSETKEPLRRRIAEFCQIYDFSDGDTPNLYFSYGPRPNQRDFQFNERRGNTSQFNFSQAQAITSQMNPAYDFV